MSSRIAASPASHTLCLRVTEPGLTLDATGRRLTRETADGPIGPNEEVLRSQTPNGVETAAAAIVQSAERGWVRLVLHWCQPPKFLATLGAVERPRSDLGP